MAKFKYILTVIIILCTITAYAQPAQYTPMTAAGYQMKRLKVDSTLHPPSFCGVPTLRGSTLKDGALAIDTCNVILYMWTYRGGWDTVNTGGSKTDTTSLSNRINSKLSISDTSSMLSPYSRTNVVNASLATKLNISDTASMLSPYLRAIDTTNKWVNTITRTPGKDSIIYFIGGTRYAIKDSVGNGGGGGGGGKIYYFNGSVNLGTFGGITMYELGDTAITGTAANFTRATTGNIANFITDVNKPGLLQIPAGVWTIDAFLSETGGGSNHAQIYAKLEKWDGSTITTIATSPVEEITNGNVIDLYTYAVSVPTTTLSVTDRIIIQFYIQNTNGKTVTLYTQNGYVAEVHTTFTTGIGALNGLTTQSQTFAVGTSGTDFEISSSSSTHTFNLPTASATNRGALSSTDWSTFNGKQNTITNPVTGTGTSTRVAFWNSSSSISSNTNLFWDNTNNRLGIGLSSPATTLDILGKANIEYSATTDFPLVIKNSNASAATSNVLSFDCSATGADQPVFINLASSNAKGMSFFASNQAITSTPVAAGFQMFSTSSTNFPGQMYFDAGANNNSSIIFRTAQTSGTIAQRMRIFANGNVSISSSATNPNYLFSVAGVSQATQFKLSALNTAPASATATGTLGEIRIVNGFIYVCVATNTWQRTALATW